MGKVDAFTIVGLIMWFWSGDHLPPHFHAKKPGEWEMRIHILETRKGELSFDLKWGDGPSGKLKGELAKLVVKHREALYEEWSLKTRTEG